MTPPPGARSMVPAHRRLARRSRRPRPAPRRCRRRAGPRCRPRHGSGQGACRPRPRWSRRGCSGLRTRGRDEDRSEQAQAKAERDDDEVLHGFGEAGKAGLLNAALDRIAMKPMRKNTNVPTASAAILRVWICPMPLSLMLSDRGDGPGRLAWSVLRSAHRTRRPRRATSRSPRPRDTPGQRPAVPLSLHRARRATLSAPTDWSVGLSSDEDGPARDDRQAVRHGRQGAEPRTTSGPGSGASASWTRRSTCSAGPATATPRSMTSPARRTPPRAASTSTSRPRNRSSWSCWTPPPTGSSPRSSGPSTRRPSPSPGRAPRSRRCWRIFSGPSVHGPAAAHRRAGLGCHVPGRDPAAA